MAGTWSEDQIGKKWDHCFADAVIKIGKLLNEILAIIF